MFCARCQKITTQALVDAYQHFRQNGGYFVSYYRNPPPEPEKADSLFLAHHSSYSSLVTAAEGGCELCLAIDKELSVVPGRIALIEASERNGIDTRIRIAIGATENYGRWRMFDHIAVVIGFPVQTMAMSQEFYEKWFLEHEVDSFWVKFSLWQCSDFPDSLNRFSALSVGWPYMGTGFACQESFDLARKWLRDCVLTCPKENCSPPEDTILPTRLIDLGQPGTLDPPKLRLSGEERGKYVALSHCWGGDIPSKTTMALITSYMQALPTLPRSFEDALRITRELGFRYLWIDSLCIIQDSLEDWEHESATMRDVYRNAVITISASASKNSRGGLLNLYGYDEPNVRKWCRLRHSNDIDSETVQLSSFYEKENFEYCVDKLPLAQRGWTLQERLLSQRILHYGKDQLYFQCRTNHLNADRTPVAYKIGTNTALLDLSKPPIQDIVHPNPTSGDWISERWRGVISSYTSHRELTNPRDKFPALSGIASLFQEKTEDQYLAGLWKRDFGHGLLWRLGDRPGPGNIKWKVFHDRALSWSWARWDGSVTFPFDAETPVKDDYTAVLLDQELQYKGLNLYGELSGGVLKLRCWIRLMTFAEISEVIGSPALDWPRDNWDFKDEHEAQSQLLEDDHVYTVACVGTFVFGPPTNIKKGYILLNTVPGALIEMYERVGMAPHKSYGFEYNFDPREWKQVELAVK